MNEKDGCVVMMVDFFYIIQILDIRHDLTSTFPSLSIVYKQRIEVKEIFAVVK